MSEREVVGIMECLGQREGMNLVNVKFFRGDRDLLSADELRAEVQRLSETRRPRDPQARGEAPRSFQPKTNIRELVASL